MTKDQPKQHGGRRPGAGRKPSLKPLAIIRLADPQTRAALVALTIHQRHLSGNPQLSQEQVAAKLIQAAQRQLEKSNNQVLPLQTPLSSTQMASLENTNNQTTLPLAAPISEIPALLENTNNQDSLPQTPLGSTQMASLENTNNQVLPVELAATTAAITTLRQEINGLVTTLRTKSAMRLRDGKQLLTLLTELITLHAAQIVSIAAR